MVRVPVLFSQFTRWVSGQNETDVGFWENGFSDLDIKDFRSVKA